MCDGVNGAARRGPPRTSALFAPPRPVAGDPTAAAAGAAHDVLTAIYPRRSGLYDAQLASDLERSKSSAPATAVRNHYCTSRSLPVSTS